MRITKWGELGVLTLALIARKKAFAQHLSTDKDQVPVAAGSKRPLVSAHEIAEAIGIDVDYARQVLQRLKNAGLITTVRGPSGGYLLAKSPAEISLEDILIATEGAAFEIVCDSKPIHQTCAQAKHHCNLRALWSDLGEHISAFLKNYSLQQILDIDPSWTPGPTNSLIQITSREGSS